jgi:transcriptional regulator of arginine metabolism
VAIVNKNYRQGLILKLIRNQTISTQEELAAELKKVGVSTTQVTLSRDMRDLGLVKTPDGYRQIAPQPAGPDLATIIAEFLQDVRVAQNLLVLKTPPAHASTLAVSLDQEEWPEVVGTIAGDDTVLVIAPDAETARSLQGKLLGYLGE